MKNRQAKKAFTLIELLVVITVLGLLSSIVLIGLKNSTTKAKYAKLLQFSGTIKHSIGSSIISEWNLNEGSGNIAADGSGGNNNVQFYGPDPYWANSDIKELGKTATLGNLNYLALDPMPDVSNLCFSHKITAEVWFKLPVVETNTIVTSHFIVLTGGYYLLSGGPGGKEFDFTIENNGGGSVCNFRTSTPNTITDGQWHQIVVSFKDHELPQFYLDGGKLASPSAGCTDQAQWVLDTVCIPGFTAGFNMGVSNFPISIDSIRIYNEYIKL